MSDKRFPSTPATQRNGTHRTNTPKSLPISRSRLYRIGARVVFHDPVETEGATEEALIKAVRASIESALPDVQQQIKSNTAT